MTSVVIKEISFLFVTLAVGSLVIGQSQKDVDAFATNLVFAAVFYLAGSVVERFARKSRRVPRYVRVSPFIEDDDCLSATDQDISATVIRYYEQSSWLKPESQDSMLNRGVYGPQHR